MWHTHQLVHGLKALEEESGERIIVCVTGDHSTAVEYGDHSAEPVPFSVAAVGHVVRHLAQVFGVCVCVYVCVCDVCVCGMLSRAHTRRCADTHVYRRTFIHAYTYVYVYDLYICICVCVHVCVRV